MSDGYQRDDAAIIGPQIEALIASGQSVTLQISGDSMRPTLKPRRDAVLLAPISSLSPRRGDIIFFKRVNGEYVLHRVLSVTPKGFIFNGDAQGWTEGPITQDQVIAKVTALMRKGQVIDVTEPLYRAYVTCWRITRPVRKPLFALWRAIKAPTMRGKGKQP